MTVRGLTVRTLPAGVAGSRVARHASSAFTAFHSGCAMTVDECSSYLASKDAKWANARFVDVHRPCSTYACVCDANPDSVTRGEGCDEEGGLDGRRRSEVRRRLPQECRRVPEHRDRRRVRGLRPGVEQALAALVRRAQHATRPLGSTLDAELGGCAPSGDLAGVRYFGVGAVFDRRLAEVATKGAGELLLGAWTLREERQRGVQGAVG